LAGRHGRRSGRHRPMTDAVSIHTTAVLDHATGARGTGATMFKCHAWRSSWPTFAQSCEISAPASPEVAVRPVAVLGEGRLSGWPVCGCAGGRTVEHAMSHQ